MNQKFFSTSVERASLSPSDFNHRILVLQSSFIIGAWLIKGPSPYFVERLTLFILTNITPPKKNNRIKDLITLSEVQI